MKKIKIAALCAISLQCLATRIAPGSKQLVIIEGMTQLTDKGFLHRKENNQRFRDNPEGKTQLEYNTEILNYIVNEMVINYFIRKNQINQTDKYKAEYEKIQNQPAQVDKLNTHYFIKKIAIGPITNYQIQHEYDRRKKEAKDTGRTYTLSFYDAREHIQMELDRKAQIKGVESKIEQLKKEYKVEVRQDVLEELSK